MVRPKQRRKKKESQRTHLSSVKIFGFLLRNGIKETDIDGFETKVLRQNYAKLGGPKGLPPLKGPKQVHSIYSTVEELTKPKDKDYKQKSDLKSTRAIVRQINLCHDKRNRAQPLTRDPKPSAHERVKWSGGREKSFWDSLTWEPHSLWYQNLLVKPYRGSSI